ncbi:amidase [Microbacterium sp. 18062]|uniref:amidase n=1 Tax=Microbacterium sp. 18062 TaxID=2681410 RepID=UPI00135B62DD|nr:amidase [Microbacterium sp. 18062]
MTDEGVLGLDGVAQAALVRGGEVSPTELADLAIARIERIDPVVGAVVHRRYDAARREAAQVDSEAPLAGVPTLIKCTTAIAGEPHDLGSWALSRRGRRAAADAPMVAAYREAGLVLLGQSAAPEFALVSTSESRAHGVTRNPWALSRTSGGSSGGASAAVAAGYVPIAMGGDGGGSTRMPASFCHLVGLKPSRRLIGTAPGGDRWGHSVPGVLTRSVRDTAVMMDILRDAMPGDLGRRFDRGAFTKALDSDPARLRIGVVTNASSSAAPVDPEVDAAVVRAAAVFADLGHHVEEAYPAALMSEENTRYFFDALSVTATASIDALGEELGAPIPEEELDPVVLHWHRRGMSISGIELARAFVGIEKLTADLAQWWDSGFDLLLAPVFPEPPRLLGWPWADPNGIQDSVDVLRFTAPFNSSGQPALALPVGFASSGAPVGVQIVGAVGSDDLLLAVGRQFERARLWENERPVLDDAVLAPYRGPEQVVRPRAS